MGSIACVNANIVAKDSRQHESDDNSTQILARTVATQVLEAIAEGDLTGALQAVNAREQDIHPVLAYKLICECLRSRRIDEALDVARFLLQDTDHRMNLDAEHHHKARSVDAD